MLFRIGGGYKRTMAVARTGIMAGAIGDQMPRLFHGWQDERVP